MTTPDPRDILAGMTYEMRASLGRLRRGPKWLGGSPPAIPKGTAAALRRRELVENADGTLRIQLTELGRRVAIAHLRDRLPKSPIPEHQVRLDLTLHARVGDRFEEGCYDDRLGEVITLRKDAGGSYTGRLIAASLVNDGDAIRLTLDLPAPTHEA